MQDKGLLSLDSRSRPWRRRRVVGVAVRRDRRSDLFGCVAHGGRRVFDWWAGDGSVYFIRFACVEFCVVKFWDLVA